MKKLIFFIAILSILMGCKKASYVAKFDESPQQRASDQINLVSTTLTSATNGWIATLPTGAGGGYSFFMIFDNNQNVTMYSDMTDKSATEGAKSYYRVKQDIGTDLVFDSYNYISMLNDPDAAVLGGAAKLGYNSDNDFTFDRSTTDSIVFIGKKFRQPFKLVKATAAQKASYEAAGLKAAMDKFKAFFTNNKFPYIEIPSGAATLKIGVSINSTNNLSIGKRTSFLGVMADGKTIKTSGQKIAFTLDGASILNTGLIFEGITFVKYAWKDATTLALYDSTGKEYVIKTSPTPLTPLFLVLGSGTNLVSVPEQTTFPGWSADFISRRTAIANTITRWSISTGALKLRGFTLSFNDVTKRMVVVFNNTPDGAAAFSLTFNYTYTKTDAGVFKFTLGVLGGNEAAIGPDLAPILAQRLNVDTFTVDYFVHPTTGILLAQFKSIEHPDFTFTGAI